MGVLDGIQAWFRGENGQNAPKTRDFTELLEKYDIVDLTEGAVVVAKRDNGAPKLAERPDAQAFLELGSSGATYYGQFARGEYNSNVRGLEGVRLFDKMVRSDAGVRASLQLARTPVLTAGWYVEASSDSRRDQRIRDFVEWNLFDGMTITWSEVLANTLLMLKYGVVAVEKVFENKETPYGYRTCWRKLAPRHPADFMEIMYDKEGGLKAIKMWYEKEIDIPIEKLAVFTFDKEAGDAQGMSLLRSAYQHWFMASNLYKIDAIQKERHGIGIPVIVLPLGFTDTDRILADQIGRNLRANEKAHVVLPPGWVLEFAKLEGLPVSPLDSAQWHNKQILANVLYELAGDRESQELFHKANRLTADIVRDVMNRYVIRQLVDYNWTVEKYPKLKVRHLGETIDWRTLSFAIRNFIGAGALNPDDRLEDWIRDEMGLPPADLEAREERKDLLDQPVPGAPSPPTVPRVGLPRQAPAPNMRSAQRPPNPGRAGLDRSGG